VIVTGGLGPTATDITRDVLSAYTGIALLEQPDVLRGFEQRLGTPRDRMRANLRRQSRVPSQGTYLPNPSGSAVGLVFEFQDKAIVALPGPPRELQPMVQQHLVPYLARKFGIHTLGSSLTIRFVGLGQSQIDQIIRDQVELPAQVMQSTQFEAGRVDYTFTLPGEDAADRRLLEQLRRDLETHLGDRIYACDAATTLEEAAAAVFRVHGKSVALAEIGSQGLLAAGFCQSAAGRQMLGGAFVAPTAEKMKTLLSIPDGEWESAGESPLELIAQSAARHAHSDWSIVVGAHEVTGIAGAEGRGVEVLHVVARSPQGRYFHGRWPWQDPARAASQLFDFLRRLPVESQ
jgi:nicotinamide-nucleotide amidase